MKKIIKIKDLIIKKFFQNTLQRSLFIGLTALILIGIYLLWNNIQVEQCERLMTKRGLEIISQLSKPTPGFIPDKPTPRDTYREKVIGEKAFFCIKKLYGIDLSKEEEVQFTRPFPK